jgi:hypothetical protein
MGLLRRGGRSVPLGGGGIKVGGGERITDQDQFDDWIMRAAEVRGDLLAALIKLVGEGRARVLTDTTGKTAGTYPNCFNNRHNNEKLDLGFLSKRIQSLMEKPLAL